MRERDKHVWADEGYLLELVRKQEREIVALKGLREGDIKAFNVRIAELESEIERLTKENAEVWEQAAKVICGFCQQGYVVKFINKAFRHNMPPNNETPWVVCRANDLRAAKEQSNAK